MRPCRYNAAGAKRNGGLALLKDEHTWLREIEEEAEESDRTIRELNEMTRACHGVTYTVTNPRRLTLTSWLRAL